LRCPSRHNEDELWFPARASRASVRQAALATPQQTISTALSQALGGAGELDMIKESGSAVSVSPGSELRIGYGYPQISEMLAKGSPLGISVDTSALIGSSNLFGVLKPAHPAWAGDASGSQKGDRGKRPAGVMAPTCNRPLR